MLRQDGVPGPRTAHERVQRRLHQVRERDQLPPRCMPGHRMDTCTQCRAGTYAQRRAIDGHRGSTEKRAPACRAAGYARLCTAPEAQAWARQARQTCAPYWVEEDAETPAWMDGISGTAFSTAAPDNILVPNADGGAKTCTGSACIDNTRRGTFAEAAAACNENEECDYILQYAEDTGTGGVLPAQQVIPGDDVHYAKSLGSRGPACAPTGMAARDGAVLRTHQP